MVDSKESVLIQGNSEGLINLAININTKIQKRESLEKIEIINILEFDKMLKCSTQNPSVVIPCCDRVPPSVQSILRKL